MLRSNFRRVPNKTSNKLFVFDDSLSDEDNMVHIHKKQLYSGWKQAVGLTGLVLSAFGCWWLGPLDLKLEQLRVAQVFQGNIQMWEDNTEAKLYSRLHIRGEIANVWRLSACHIHGTDGEDDTKKDHED